MATPSRGFHALSWGRQFLSFNNLSEIIPIDLAAGVGASGWGSTTVSLPGNPGLAGVDVTLQWIVHNAQSPWLYDTSNGLVVRLGL